VGKPSLNAAQPYAKAEGRVFLLVPAYPGCPGTKAFKRLLLLCRIVHEHTYMYRCVNFFRLLSYCLNLSIQKICTESPSGKFKSLLSTLLAKRKQQPLKTNMHPTRGWTQPMYRVGQIKRGHTFELITSEVLLVSSLFLAENKAI